MSEDTAHASGVDTAWHGRGHLAVFRKNLHRNTLAHVRVLVKP